MIWNDLRPMRSARSLDDDRRLDADHVALVSPRRRRRCGRPAAGAAGAGARRGAPPASGCRPTAARSTAAPPCRTARLVDRRRLLVCRRTGRTQPSSCPRSSARWAWQPRTASAAAPRCRSRRRRPRRSASSIKSRTFGFCGAAVSLRIGHQAAASARICVGVRQTDRRRLAVFGTGSSRGLGMSPASSRARQLLRLVRSAHRLGGLGSSATAVLGVRPRSRGDRPCRPSARGLDSSAASSCQSGAARRCSRRRHVRRPSRRQTAGLDQLLGHASAIPSSSTSAFAAPRKLAPGISRPRSRPCAPGRPSPSAARSAARSGRGGRSPC